MIVLDSELSAKLINGELIINVNLHNNMHSCRVGWQISGLSSVGKSHDLINRKP